MGHWSKYEIPRVADISSVNVPRIVAMGQSTPIRISVDVGGQPSSNVTVNYFVSNKDGIVVARGQAQPESPRANSILL